MRVDELDVMLPGMPTISVELAEREAAEQVRDQLSELALQLDCRTCGAVAGAWCRTRSGRGAAGLHASRTLVADAIFWLGWESHKRFADRQELASESADS